jgi:hypothetical protein
LITILLTSCGKTKYIYKTEIKEIEVVKLMPVDPQLTKPLIIPIWEQEQAPKYIDLKHLFIETREVLKLANQQLNIIRESQLEDE